jgi:hypothetical protein
MPIALWKSRELGSVTLFARIQSPQIIVDSAAMAATMALIDAANFTGLPPSFRVD